MDNKKYYYLKLKDNFFERPEIKAIEGIESGYEYICIMQKMYLRSLCRSGKLMLTDTIPYSVKTLASVLGHKQETIKYAIEVFKQFGLLEIMNDESIYLLEIQNFIGESSTEADRIRNYRERIKNEKSIPYICTPELELELELEKEIKIKKEIKNNINKKKKSESSDSGKMKKEIINKFFESYLFKTGSKYILTGKDKGAIRNTDILETESIINKLTLYFDNEYWFNKNNQYSLWSFLQNINSINQSEYTWTPTLKPDNDIQNIEF